MKFDAQTYPYTSKRNVVYAKNGMACSGNPTTSACGLEILQKGGNAIDAAIAMAASLPVAEPTGNGLGSDCFALIWFEGKLYGINGSGPAPLKASIEELKKRGYDKIPSYGIHPINVPGAVDAWVQIHERFGKLSLEEVFQPAINYANEGFPVSPNISRLWEEAFEIYSKHKDKAEFQPWFDTFCPNGTFLKAGDIFVNKDIGKSLELIAKTKGRAFYEGELADKIVDFMEKHDGFITKEDLKKYKAEWVEPVSTNYRGYDVWEIPPNGHGITVLMALNILKQYEFKENDIFTEDTLHKQIEAIKLAMVDTAKYVTEPSCMKYTTEELLSMEYAKRRKELINEKALLPEAGEPVGNCTVYFCAADKYGNMVSIIQSNFRGFGSGIVIPGTSISLNDRMENFSFDENHTNVLKGGKRPYHTIIPAFLTKDNKPVSAFGIMGGWMQPQAHVQVVMNMIDFKLNPQAALDAPRFQWIGGKNVEVEQDFSNSIILNLRKRGHNIIVQPDPYHMGRGQVILRDEKTGVLCGGTEKRTDGQIASY